MMNRVEVILPGEILRDGERIVEAHSSVTLVRTASGNILVDTSDRSWRQRLLEALDGAGVGPSEIDVVVATHLHHDHTGNNDLFTNARLLARREERPGPEYSAVTEDVDVVPGVRLIHLPGHTLGSMGVLVSASSACVIAGDAVPTKDNFDKWLPPAYHVDREAAMRSMQLIGEAADMVVPGHGAMFRNERARRHR
jgi:glyoxylase-like metal-dependent hydrolase (beta-lactamase superfamily II)